MLDKKKLPPSIFRRVAAIFYDSIILASILILATFIYVGLNNFNAIPSGNIIFQVYLTFISYLFFIFFWTKYGQTTGMTAWKLQVLDKNNQKINLTQASVRFVFALITISFFGVGLIYAILDPKNRTLYDILSKTKLSYIKNI